MVTPTLCAELATLTGLPFVFSTSKASLLQIIYVMVGVRYLPPLGLLACMLMIIS